MTKIILHSKYTFTFCTRESELRLGHSQPDLLLHWLAARHPERPEAEILFGDNSLMSKVRSGITKRHHQEPQDRGCGASMHYIMGSRPVQWPPAPAQSGFAASHALHSAAHFCFAHSWAG